MKQSPGRKIVIMGMSHCGSTMLSAMFNSVPGVASLGETHWILKKNIKSCFFCRPKVCPVIKNLGKKSELNTDNLYDRLIESTGCDTLITADKVISFTAPLIRQNQFEALVLFKRPECFADSYCIRRKNKIFPYFPDFYSNWYESLIGWTENYASKTYYLEYESFIPNWKIKFRNLCKKLNLKQPEFPLIFPPKNSHIMAGNRSTFQGERYKDNPIVLDNRWVKSLTAKQKLFIKNHNLCQSTWKRLKERKLEI